MTIVVTSGGFDPLHSGHLKLLQQARELGSQLIVLLNSDSWLVAKKGKPFMSYTERREILLGLRCVTDVYSVNDSDGTVVPGIAALHRAYPTSTLVFAKGGDRGPTNTPEAAYCYQNGIVIAYNVGGGKIQSSSELVKGYHNG